MKFIQMSLLASTIVLFTACGSIEDIVESFDPGDDDAYVPTAFTGQFVDTYVKGLGYACIGMVDGETNQVTDTGITNDKGEFTCTDKGALVEFSIGDYAIGSYQNSGFDDDMTPIVTPYSLGLSQEAALNVAQLLQTLNDGTTEGALTIPAGFTALNDVTIELDNTDFDALMADALPNVTVLVSEEEAQAHLDESGITAPLVETPEYAALATFVSGKSITFSGSGGEMIATFASDNYYEETSDTHFCSGSWGTLSDSTMLISCIDEGATIITEADMSTLNFIGELQTGMTVTGFDEGDVTITNIETAVNPDA